MASVRARKKEVEPLHNEMHKAVARIGMVSNSDEVWEAISRVKEIADNASADDIAVCKATFAKCVSAVPSACHAYATLLRVLGEYNTELGDALVKACISKLVDAIQACHWHTIKCFFRLFGWLARTRTIPGVHDAITDFLNQALDQPSALWYRKDSIVYTCLAALPWCEPEFGAKLQDRLDQYFTSRSKSQSLACRRPVLVQQYNYIQDLRTAVEQEPDALDVLYLELRDNWSQCVGILPDCAPKDIDADLTYRWPHEICLPPIPFHSAEIVYTDLSTCLYLFFPLLDGKPATIATDRIAVQNVGINQDHELFLQEREATPLPMRSILRELTRDALYCFHADLPLLATVLKDLPTGKGGTYAVIAAVFDSVFTLPHPPLPVAFYASLLAEMCKHPDSPYALAVAEAFDVLIEQSPVLDPELTIRLHQLFTWHLANHGYRWLWDLQDRDSDARTGTCKKLFNFELLHYLTRTAPKHILAAAIPTQFDKGGVLTQEETIRYKFKNAGVPFKKEADSLLASIRGGCSPDDVITMLKGLQYEGTAATERDRASILVNCLLFLGSDTIAHEKYLFQQYWPALKQTVESSYNIISAAAQFWDTNPHHCIMTMNNLLQLNIVTPAHVVKWLTDDMGDMYERSFIWEIVYLTVDYLTDKVWNTFEELIGMEGAEQDVANLDVPQEVKNKAKRKIEKKRGKLEALLYHTYLFELRAGIKALLEGLIKKVKSHYRKERKTLAQGGVDEQAQRRTQAKNFVWCRSALGHFNAIGRRYLPFILPFVDMLHEELFLQGNAPSVTLNIFFSWRLVRGRRVRPNKGGSLLHNDMDPLQRETYRRISTTAVGGAEVTSTLFDRLDAGQLDLVSLLPPERKVEDSSSSSHEDDAASEASDESLGMDED